MFLKNLNRNITFYNFLFLICLFSHFFMWDYDYLYTFLLADINISNPKILILFFFFYHLINFYPSTVKNYNEILKKNKSLIIFTLFLVLHFFLNTYDEIFFINKLLKIIFFVFIFFFCFNFYTLIKDNLKCVIYFFLLVNFFIILLNLFLSTTNLSEIILYNNYIFKERSHYAMIMVPVIFFLLVSIKKVFSYLTFLLLLSVFLSSFLYYSTTLFAGILITSLFFLIFFFKNFTKKKFIIFFIFFFFLLGSEYRTYLNKNISKNVFSIANDKKIKYLDDFFLNSKKFNETSYKSIEYINEKKENLKKERSQEKNISIREFFLKKDSSQLPVKFHSNTGDLSTEVTINSFKIVYYSLLDNKFLGNGINNYEKAFEKHMLNEIIPPYHEIYLLNYNDGSNNLSKMLVEFGFFSFFFLYIFMKYTLCNRVPLNYKMFFISIILTQLIRGAGYTNGGFIFSIAIMFGHLLIYNKLLPFKKS